MIALPAFLALAMTAAASPARQAAASGDPRVLLTPATVLPGPGAAIDVSGNQAPTLQAQLVGAGAAPTTKFVSKEYGYSITLPGDPSSWISSFAFVTWSVGSIEPGSPAFDTFTDTRSDRLYLIAARHPPTGYTLAKWTAFFTSPQTFGCQTHGPLSSSTLSGVPARVFTYTCSDVPYGIGITAIHDRLGYVMLVPARGDTSHASDRRAFDAARRSFRFLR